VNLGYQDVEVPGVTIYKARQKRGVDTRRLKRALKRRNTIEPIIDHLKNDGLLGRNYLKGELGNALHAILCGVGHNIRLTLRQLRVFWPHFWQSLSRLWGVFSSEPFLSFA
jgi:IS5 family transposase